MCAGGMGIAQGTGHINVSAATSPRQTVFVQFFTIVSKFRAPGKPL